MEFFGPARSWPHRATPALVASVRALPAANRRLVVEFGTWSAPWVLATLASIVHDREDAARSQQHNCRDDNQGDFHCGSPTTKGPPLFGAAKRGGERPPWPLFSIRSVCEHVPPGLVMASQNLALRRHAPRLTHGRRQSPRTEGLEAGGDSASYK